MAKVRHKRHDALVLYPHHRKPFRVHHLASLIVATLIVLACVFELGFAIGRDHGTSAPDPAQAQASPVSPTVVRSGYGFSLTASPEIFDVSGTQTEGGAQSSVTGSALKDNRPLTEVVVKARPGAVSGRLAAAELTVKVNPDASALSDAQKQPDGQDLSPEQAAAKLFPAQAGSEVDSRIVSAVSDSLNNVPVQKTTYEFTGSHGGKSYAVVWAGAIKGRAFAVELDGLAGSAAIPGEFANVLASLNVSSGQAVLGASTVFASQSSDKGKLDAKYLSDALSPAVVQIFHTVCGILTVDGKTIGQSACVSFSGSGFLATSSGYIATNGHVVVYTAKDALADLIISNDAVLEGYLQGLGLNAAQIAATKSDPAALAALISKIYDLPDSSLHFADKGDMTLVALGSDQPDIKKLISIRTSGQLAQFKRDTSSIKQATIVGYNYNAKDSFTAIANPKAGFSASDVALLKVNVNGAPAIPIETGRVVQNEDIVIMGFPGDANNSLTDNQQTDVTVTDGVVSSIRQAAGGKGTLYQSDADASHGSSGGPAIDQEGKVIGLMTYRYADSNSGDAAKSYIRAIADFTQLAADKGVTIDPASATQDEWEKGLELYSHSHYSAALKDFDKVQAAYPAQRLVASYISGSEQAIADGKDVQQVPVGAIVSVLAVALIAAAGAVFVMIRHHALHKVYRTSVPDAANPQPVYMARPQSSYPVAAGGAQPPQPQQPGPSQQPPGQVPQG